MKIAVVLLALLAGTAMAVDKVPSIMVTTSTNAYTHGMLAGTNLQQDLDFIDAELSRRSNATVAASNRAEAAYLLAEAAIATSGVSTAQSQMTFSYQNTGTWTVAICTGGQAWCYASTQTIGKVHIGMAVTGTVFNATAVITNINYETRKVELSLVCAASGTNVTVSFWGSGTYTNIVPTRFTRCRITVTGGGGAGGADSSAADAGGGGGAGGTSIGWWTMATGTAYTVTVGNGGASVTNDTGATGGTSSFGSLQTATGGAGGTSQAAAISYGGLGGVGTGGQILLKGGSGIDGGASRPGYGGASFWGGGGSGNDNLSAKQKDNTVTFGSGGGGGDSAELAGKGGDGIVVVEYF